MTDPTELQRRIDAGFETQGQPESVQVYEHVLALAYPRRVGTDAERQAAAYIAGQFEASGLRVKREPFVVSHFPIEIGGRLVFLLCIALMLLGAWLAADWPLASAASWAAVAYLINCPWRLARYIGSRWPPRAYSENLVGHLPTAASSPAGARVVFMAHYDSKSQLLPTGVRVALVSASTALAAVWAVLALTAAAGYADPLAVAGPWNGAVLVSVMLAALILNLTGNRSPGALDNASGVGVLLELAQRWRPPAGVDADVVFAATGAEEAGLDGARHFLLMHDAWWQEKPTLLINLESVGAGPRLYLAGQQNCLRLAHAVAEELQLPHQTLRVLGAGMDHQPFVAAGLNAVSILGDVVRASFAMHSPRDSVKLIEREALRRAGLLASRLAECWVRLHQSAPLRRSTKPLGELKAATSSRRN